MRIEIEANILKKAKAGDVVSFEAIVECYYDRLLRFCFTKIGHKGVADELANDVLFRFWRNIKKFDTTKPILPYLLRCSNNACINWKKKRDKVEFVSMVQVDRVTGEVYEMDFRDEGLQLDHYKVEFPVGIELDDYMEK